MNHFLNRSMPSAGSLILLPFLLGALLLPPGGVNAQSPRIEVGEDLSEASDMKSCFLAAANAAGADPTKAVLLKALEAAHSGVAVALPSVPEARWSEPTPVEEVPGVLPTLGDSFVFVMAAHENMYLGQLSAWRRVQGMGRV